MKRRNAIKGMAILPLTGGLLSKDLVGSPLEGNNVLPAGQSAAAVVTEGSFMAKTNIFRSIGVEPVINCMGTYTIIGGSIERPAVRAAMEAAAHNFVQYDELADGIGQKLADLTGTEWGMVSAGCAAGLKHVTAACVTGGNPEILIRIPDLTGLEKTEVIIPRYARTSYDHAIRNIGVKIVHVTTAEELEKAINPKTAMIYLTTSSTSATGQPLSLEVIAGIAKPKNIPVLVDAAAENLTIPPVHLKRGATIVAYSGGKAICGPQCAGLLLGDKAILMSAWQASSPHHGPGRDNKVGREEMIGMLAAVEDWTKRDHEGDWKKWMGWIDTMEKKVSGISGIKTIITEPAGLGNKSPVLTVSWDPAKLNVTAFDIAEELGRNKPRVALAARDQSDGTTTVNITTGQMQAGEEKIVADRLFEVLSKKRSPKPEMATPVANLSGRWNVNMKFFSSTSDHSFTIEQEGNWLSGTHRGDLDVRNLNGTIDGDQVRLRTTIPIAGDSLSFLFSGVVAGDSLSGNVHLGEYRTATFTATRNKSKAVRERVQIPGGPPLAT
ncbi:aminotransferase class V-fold PLP-dependent enzyme [Daejeonella sp.]|uniref:aminotransferase class V-fold PLP-dependent enzyme n=1 Tax=Daejeonella sp. TaxID=2805397 RepID=UPI0030C0A16E